MRKHTFVATVAVAVLLLDQLSKWYIRSTLDLYASIPVIDACFHVTHVRNPGGAFSLFADVGDTWRASFFLIASGLAIGTLLYFVRQVAPRQRWLLFALASVLGGALGNLVDRLTTGMVTDFLDLHWRGYHWPAFNVADSFITTGVVILLVHSLFATNQSPVKRG